MGDHARNHEKESGREESAVGEIGVEMQSDINGSSLFINDPFYENIEPWDSIQKPTTMDPNDIHESTHGFAIVTSDAQSLYPTPLTNLTSNVAMFDVDDAHLSNPTAEKFTSQFYHAPPPPTQHSRLRDETHDDLLKHSRTIRNKLLSRISEDSKRLLAVLSIYDNQLSGKQHDASISNVAKSMDISEERLHQWLLEYHHGKSHTDIDTKPFRNTKRVWLLEEYPELLKQAKEWVDGKVEMEINGIPFKITEFQKWVNEILLQPILLNPTKNVTPISHSTARVWLARLGYQKNGHIRVKTVDCEALFGSNDLPETLSSNSTSKTHFRSSTWSNTPNPSQTSPLYFDNAGGGSAMDFTLSKVPVLFPPFSFTHFRLANHFGIQEQMALVQFRSRVRE